jgi:hypothetical protein
VGLDSSTNTIGFRIPVHEVSGLLPADGSPPQEIIGLIYLFNEIEVSRVRERDVNRVAEINQRHGPYADVRLERDDHLDVYNLYPREGELGASTTWHVLKRPPPIAEADLIATCTEFAGALTISCHPPIQLIGNVGIDLNVPAEYLPYLSAIQNHVASLVRTWQ